MPPNAHLLFISYRHSDVSTTAGRLADALKDRYSPGNVFIDVEDLGAGSSTTELEERVQRAAVLLVVIGIHWVRAQTSIGKRAIDQDNDWVRREIRTALNSETIVIPILVDGAQPLTQELELPPDIAPLIDLNPYRLSSHEHFRSDFEALGCAIEEKSEALRRAAGNASTRLKPSNLGARPSQPIVGRQRELAQLTELMRAAGEQRQLAVVAGLAGVGKTRLALEFAFQNGDEYEAMLQVDAESFSSLQAGYAGLADVLGLDERDSDSPGARIKQVKDWLKKTTRWLLILENADNTFERWNEFLPERNTGHIVVTTRQRQIRGLSAAQIPLEPLARGDGAKLLQQIANRPNLSEKERQAAEDLTVELGGLPLCLLTAGAWIGETSATFHDYLAGCRARHSDGHSPSGTRSPEYASVLRNLADTLDDSFQKISESAPGTAALLGVTACLAADPIPFELILKGCPEVFEGCAAPHGFSMDDPMVVPRLLKPLNDYWLVELDTDAKVYKVHRLVQEAWRLTATEAERRKWIDRAVAAIDRTFPDPRDNSMWDVCGRILPHAVAVLKHAQEVMASSERLARVALDVGFYLNARARYADAHAPLEFNVALRKSMLADGLSALAWAYQREGNDDRSKELLKEAVWILEEAVGKGDLRLAGPLSSLGWQYHISKQRVEAEACLRRCLNIRLRHLGLSHSDVAKGLENYTLVLSDKSQFPRARRLLRRSLRIRERAQFPNELEIARGKEALGRIHLSVGLTNEALQLYQDSLRIREKIHNAHHPTLAHSVEGIATVYASNKDSRASEYFERALKIYRATLPESHRNIVRTEQAYRDFLEQTAEAET